MRAVKENAYAKINLFLDVVSKRADGYHDINTVMHSVSLCDTITVALAPSRSSSVRLSVEGNDGLVSDSKNLAVMAARLYLERTAKTANVNIKLVKNIPVASGLAGGSSDAAATLRAMNKLFNHYLSERALLALALELGSDVPYCIRGGTANCRGRGELITKLPSPKLHTVVAVANEHVSTPTAYSTLDATYSDFDGSVKTGGEDLYEKILASLAENRFDGGAVFNVFENAVFESCPKSRALKAKMYECGATAAAMSGSGPSIFGIFNSQDEAREACNALRADGIAAFYATSV